MQSAKRAVEMKTLVHVHALQTMYLSNIPLLFNTTEAEQLEHLVYLFALRPNKWSLF